MTQSFHMGPLIGSFLALLWLLCGLGLMIFLMVCAWRAMRAHEEIALTGQEFLRQWVFTQDRNRPSNS